MQCRKLDENDGNFLRRSQRFINLCLPYTLYPSDGLQSWLLGSRDQSHLSIFTVLLKFFGQIFPHPLKIESMAESFYKFAGDSPEKRQ
jgi:hypothetical protein